MSWPMEVVRDVFFIIKHMFPLLDGSLLKNVGIETHFSRRHYTTEGT